MTHCRCHLSSGPSSSVSLCMGSWGGRELRSCGSSFHCLSNKCLNPLCSLVAKSMAVWQSKIVATLLAMSLLLGHHLTTRHNKGQFHTVLCWDISLLLEGTKWSFKQNYKTAFWFDVAEQMSWVDFLSLYLLQYLNKVSIRFIKLRSLQHPRLSLNIWWQHRWHSLKCAEQWLWWNP